MFDRGGFAIGNVRIDHLRRRGNGSRNRSACHRGNEGTWRRRHYAMVGHGGMASDVGNVDIFRNDGHVGNVGNVRLRLKQHCLIVDFNVNVRPPHRAAPLEPEFRWDPWRSAIWGLVPHQRYRRQAYRLCRHRYAEFVGTTDADRFTSDFRPRRRATNPACAGPPGANSGIGSFAGEGNAGITGTSNAARLQRQSILCQRP